MNRPSGQISGDRRDRELGELLGIALAMFQENIGIILGGTAVTMILPALIMVPVGIGIAVMGGGAGTGGEVDPAKMLPIIAVGGVGVLVTVIVYMLVKIGFTCILLKISKGERPAFSEFTSNMGYFGNFLAASFLVGLIVCAGFICLVILAIFLGCKLIFTPLLVLDRGMGPIEAMKESWSLSEGQFWKIFLSAVAYTVINVIVSLIPFVGIVGQFLTFPYYELLICSIYRSRTGDLAA